ncbi:unnamed protein product [Boreogadus saida]
MDEEERGPTALTREEEKTGGLTERLHPAARSDQSWGRLEVSGPVPADLLWGPLVDPADGTQPDASCPLHLSESDLSPKAMNRQCLLYHSGNQTKDLGFPRRALSGRLSFGVRRGCADAWQSLVCRPRAPKHSSTHNTLRPRAPKHSSTHNTLRPRAPKHSSTHNTLRPRAPKHSSTHNTLRPQSPQTQQYAQHAAPQSPQTQQYAQHSAPQSPQTQQYAQPSAPQSPQTQQYAQHSAPQSP